MPFEISICIPEWNRSKAFTQLLDSVVGQITDDIRDKVEICISDDASTEDIKSIADIYKRKHPHINYFRFEKNQSIDINHLKIVEMANSPYCWTFGNDDIMLDGALKYIMQEIKENPDIDIFIGESLSGGVNLDNVYKRKFKIYRPNKDFIFEKGNTKSILLLGFISETIVKKEIWGLYAAVVGEMREEERKQLNKWQGAQFIGTLFIQLYVMFSMIKNGSKLKYLIKPIAIGRGMNGDDTFNREGVRKRWQYDMRALSGIPKQVFGENSKEVKMLANKFMIDLEQSCIRLIKTDIWPRSYKIYMHLFCDLFKYFPKNLLLYFYVLPSMLIPSFVYKSAAFIYRKIFKEKRKIAVN